MTHVRSRFWPREQHKALRHGIHGRHYGSGFQPWFLGSSLAVKRPENRSNQAAYRGREWSHEVQGNNVSATSPAACSNPVQTVHTLCSRCSDRGPVPACLLGHDSGSGRERQVDPFLRTLASNRSAVRMIFCLDPAYGSQGRTLAAVVVCTRLDLNSGRISRTRMSARPFAATTAAHRVTRLATHALLLRSDRRK